jgi:hypothetical protein
MPQLPSPPRCSPRRDIGTVAVAALWLLLFPALRKVDSVSLARRQALSTRFTLN